MASNPHKSTPLLNVLRSRRGAVAAIVLLIGIVVAVLVFVVIMTLESGDAKANHDPTGPAALAPTLHFTDVPVITAIPPTATPTLTPTETPTSTLTPTPTLTATASATPSATPTARPTRRPTRIPTKAVAQGQACVSVIGDSVAHGDGVFEIPGMGYFVAQLAPVSAFLDQQFQQARKTRIAVYNRSASAVGISSSNHPSYFSTVQYATLLQDKCQYAVIVPWINDLSSGGDPTAAAANHVQALAGLVRNLLQSNAQSRVLLLNYYQGVAVAFAQRTFAPGYMPQIINAFNQQIASACTGGALASPQIRCLDSNAAFAGSGPGYLLGQVSQSQLTASLIIPPAADVQAMLNAYFGANPGGLINGDGVHLSGVGKAMLAAYLVPYMP